MLLGNWLQSPENIDLLVSVRPLHTLDVATQNIVDSSDIRNCDFCVRAIEVNVRL
jgi:hypothetical protein